MLDRTRTSSSGACCPATSILGSPGPAGSSRPSLVISSLRRTAGQLRFPSLACPPAAASHSRQGAVSGAEAVLVTLAAGALLRIGKGAVLPLGAVIDLDYPEGEGPLILGNLR